MRILIVGGAGLMSAGTARDLLSKLSSGITKVVAADSNGERLASLKKSLADSRLETRIFDVNDRAALLPSATFASTGFPPSPDFRWPSLRRAWRRIVRM